jgi:3',5'-cyclic AMP phosphodiesterase CpdA
MRCHYMSDLHLESQEFPHRLPPGDVLILAGDLCHASCLDPARTDPYTVKQRDRVMRFAENAAARFAHVLLVAGNHDHYDGIFEDTVSILRRELPGFTALDDEAVAIDGMRFFGTMLWSDFEGADAEAMNRARRGAGEFFFVKTRGPDGVGSAELRKFRPEDALLAHRRGLDALRGCLAKANGKPTVVISHHAPSRKGLNPLHMGNGLDGSYASDLEEFMATLDGVPFWVHGHTHVCRRYRIGHTTVCSNARGFDARDASSKTFSPDASFEL